VGVGAGLDYIGLHEVAGDALSKGKIVYHGIDLVDWEYRHPSMSFDQVSVSEIESSSKTIAFLREGVDVVIFPKSITEIDEDELLGFFETLEHHIGEEFYLMVSFIKSTNTIKGREEVISVSSYMAECGYGGNAIVVKNEFDGKVDYEIIAGYRYQYTWQNYFAEHCQQCSEMKRNLCSICDHYPMLYKSHLAYGIFRFTKEVN
jgi:hypothetical protein